MRGSKSSPVSAEDHEESPSSVSASSPALRRSSRKRGAEEENAAAQPLSPPELRRSKRIRTSLQQQSSIFETPPASTKKQGRRKIATTKSVPVLTKNSGPPASLMSLPYEVLLKLLRYLDVESLENLGGTCSQFDLLIHGRFLTSLAIPFDESFLKEIAATDTLEKKPLLRLQCTKPRGGGEVGSVQYFMNTFVESRHGVREYILKSQMALLQLDKVREIDLVPRAISPLEMKSTAMWESFQDFDRIILRHMSYLDILRNLSRLEIMIVDEDFSQTVLKEFMPKLKNLLEFKVTIAERKASIRTYFYAKLEDVVMASRAPLFTLNVLGTTKKNFPKVFSNLHITRIVLSAPCTFSLYLIMKNLREVVLELREAGPGGDCCTYQKKANSDRSRHAPGLCLVHLASTYANCPKLERFGGVEVPSQAGLSFPNWNKKLKPLFHKDYVKQGGDEDLKTWTSRRWFSRRPLVPEVWGSQRIPGGCAIM